MNIKVKLSKLSLMKKPGRKFNKRLKIEFLYIAKRDEN